MATAERIAAAAAPPHNLEAEQSVLGAILLSEKTLYPIAVEDGLRPDDFYREGHRIVYSAILELHERGEPIDIVTLTEHLRERGRLEEAGGEAVLHALTASPPALGHARRYAAIVRDNALERALLSTAYEVQTSVLERAGSARDLVERAERAILDVADDGRRKEFKVIADVLHVELDKLHRLSKEGTALTGTPSGFKDLDDLTGGFQPGNLIVIAARPGMGKSALVTNIAENAAIDYQRAVALFSLEMSESELAQRFIASQARIKGDELRKGKVAESKWPKILEASQRLSKARLFVDDTSDLGILEIRAKARRLHSKEPQGLGLVIVDYLQLMRSEGRTDNRAEQVGQMSRGLKILARELDVPVIALSQLNRNVEQRGGDKRPLLSDLRESGCLTGDSRVFLPDEGAYRRMDELVGKAGFRVLAVDPETWRLEPRAVVKSFSTGSKPVSRLRTRLGRSIRATANHLFLTADGWRRLDELSPGDRIAVPRRLPAPPRRASMSAAELALLGHLIGDGCTLPRHAIQFTTNDPGLATLVADLAVRVFGNRIAPRIKQERSWYQVYLSAARHLTHRTRNPVAAWLDGMGVFGLRSHEKRVPDDVFEQPDASIALFLRHLWSTDGCIWFLSDRRQPSIYYASSSEALARNVQSLLLRLGVNAKARPVSQGSKGRIQWHVQVSGRPDIAPFVERIGGLGDAKEQGHRAIRDWLPTAAPNTNRDVIPKSVWASIVQPAMRSTGTTTRQLQVAIGTRYCGSALYKANLSRERARRVSTVLECDRLDALAESDVYWDEIASIEPDSVEEVFDLTVEGLHNFVADDIVLHNSIEQDSDLVMFIFRDEYYTREESEHQDEAELIIAKHRNGPLGKVPLTFHKQFPKFRNFADPGRFQT